MPYSQLSQELDGAEESLELARMVGDAVIAAFFSADKPKKRENMRIELRNNRSCVESRPEEGRLHCRWRELDSLALASR